MIYAALFVAGLVIGGIAGFWFAMIGLENLRREGDIRVESSCRRVL